MKNKKNLITKKLCLQLVRKNKLAILKNKNKLLLIPHAFQKNMLMKIPFSDLHRLFFLLVKNFLSCKKFNRSLIMHKPRKVWIKFRVNKILRYKRIHKNY